MNMTEDEKTILLLKYALNKKGIEDDDLYIGEYKLWEWQDAKYCLLKKSDKEWVVCFVERGIKKDESIHSSLYRAAKDCYSRLLFDAESPWTYREEWEKLTGIKF